ncbi:MAG: hypothetical protein WBL65_24070 [Bryobacteraceae bacterium]
MRRTTLGLFKWHWAAPPAMGRKLDLDVPKETIVVAVGPSDCTTVGGPIHPDVQSRFPRWWNWWDSSW